MKVSFPLSVKVSLWLLLNLMLLAAVGGGFLVWEKGFNWDALVTGRAGSRFQAVGDVIAVELRTAAPGARDEVLQNVVTEHFGEAAPHGATFYLVQNNTGSKVAGPTVTLPEAVRLKLAEYRGQRGGGPPAGRGLGQPVGPAPGPGPAATTANGPAPSNARAPAFTIPMPTPTAPRPATEAGSGPGATGVRPATETGGGPPPGTRQPAGPRDARFLVRVQNPVGYWAGVRLPAILTVNGEYLPATTLLMKMDSFGVIVPLLDLTPWLVAGAAAIGLSVLFWLPLVRSITRSLGQLTRATEQIAEGRFDTRVATTRRDELGRLGGAVNRMAVQLDRAAKGQKRFLGDIAHELGSPVGRLQVAVEILESSAAPALQPAVNDVREEVQQMSELVGELLAFTKAGLKPRDAALDAVALAPLATEVLAREGAAEGAVTLNVPPGLAVRADAALLTRAIANLVRNALRYAGTAGPVALSAHAEGAEIVIAVEDQGAGVPADTLTRLGEPFYRPEFARTRETGGAGLGLAIVRSAVEACRGTVRFSNRVPHGFRAEVRLAAV